MRLGKWIIADRDSRLGNVTDSQAISRVSAQSFSNSENQLTLCAIMPEGMKTWSLEEEIKEMRGHLWGFLRSRYGRDMLDAHKLAILEDMRLGR